MTMRKQEQRDYVDAEAEVWKDIPVGGRSCRCRAKTAHYIADVCLRYRQVPIYNIPDADSTCTYMYMSL